MTSSLPPLPHCSPNHHDHHNIFINIHMKEDTVKKDKKRKSNKKEKISKKEKKKLRERILSSSRSTFSSDSDCSSRQGRDDNRQRE